MTPPDRKRVLRLARLEKVRDVARQEALRASAEAEGTLARLQALSTRTDSLFDSYAQRSDSASGADLARLAAFRDGLRGVAATATADALRAQALADERQTGLAEAERRRQAVTDRLESARRDADRTPLLPAAARRGGTWHGS